MPANKKATSTIQAKKKPIYFSLWPVRTSEWRILFTSQYNVLKTGALCSVLERNNFKFCYNRVIIRLDIGEIGFQSTIKLWIVHFEEIWENRNLHMKRALKTLFIYCAYLQWSQYNSITLFMSIEVCSILFGWLAIQSLMLTVRLFTNKILEIRSKCF